MSPSPDRLETMLRLVRTMPAMPSEVSSSERAFRMPSRSIVPTGSCRHLCAGSIRHEILVDDGIVQAVVAGVEQDAFFRAVRGDGDARRDFLAAGNHAPFTSATL
jgi:hypothetical protein